MKRELVAALVASLVAAAAAAEPVRIEAGERAGQGWAFRRGDDCLALSADHVAAVGAMVTSAAGDEGAAVEVRRHPEAGATDGARVDLAILRLEGTLKTHCPSSTLGYHDLSPTLERIRLRRLPIAIEQAGEVGSGIVTRPVELLAINSDGRSLIIRGEVVQGESGSPIRFQGTGVGEAGLPIGLVIASLNETASVVRFDVAKAFVEQEFPIALSAEETNPGGSASAAPFELIDWRSDTPDAACGPLNAVTASPSCGWRARPVAGASSVDLTLGLGPSGRKIRSVALSLQDAGPDAGFEVATTAGDPRTATTWTPVRTCRLGGSQSASCDFAERSASGVRLRLFGEFSEILSVTLE